MNEFEYKMKKIIYTSILFLIILVAIILLIYGLTTLNFNGKTFIIISIVFFALIVPYYFLQSYLKYNLDNSYKEIVFKGLFKTYKLEYYSKQKGLTKNQYLISKEDFDNLEYVNSKFNYTLEMNELIIGTLRNTQLKAMDYNYFDDKGLKFSSGRIYAFNLRADRALKLIAGKNREYSQLKKLDITKTDIIFYTNDPDKALKHINLDRLDDSLLKLEKYGELFMEINNGSLYLIIDKLTDSFPIDNDNKSYMDMVENIDMEIARINHILNAFITKPEPKKQAKMK